MTDILNAFILLANFAFIPALTYACQLALGALGVTLVYGVLRFANFAHGETMAFGTMAVILITWLLQYAGFTIAPLPTALLALPLAILAACAVTLLFDRTIYRYYRRKKSPSLIFLIASLGIMFFLGGIIRFTIGAEDQNFADGARFIITARAFKEITGLSEGLSFRTTQAVTIIATPILMAGLFWFLKHSKSGQSMRAYADNGDLALLSGINPERVIMLTWILTATLATIAGTLYGLDKSFKPFVYLHLLLPIFAAAILGGLGSPIGAVAGAFIVAFSEIFLTFIYTKFLNYLPFPPLHTENLVQLLATEYKFAISFVILVLTLLIRPSGLFGKKET